MTMRWRTGLVALVAALASGAVGALGLGDLEVRSGLNQRLDARIALVAVKEGDLSALRVALADDAAFTRAGIERAHFLTRLRFEAVPTDDGGYIRVTSAEPIREPAFDVLVDVAWSGGRALRGYSILLETP